MFYRSSKFRSFLVKYFDAYQWFFAGIQSPEPQKTTVQADLCGETIIVRRY